MGHGRFVLAGQEYDLTHLDPFVMDVAPKAEGAPVFRVLVDFSHHAFTRDWRDGDTDDHRFGPDHDVRCFCSIRHALSRALPDIIRRSAHGKAYFPAPNYPHQRNFILVDMGQGADPYLVAFNLTKAQTKGVHVVMFVVSAHPRPDLVARSRMDSISFATLVAKTVRGERIIRPSKKK